MELRVDTHEMRKSRGAFFTPPALADFITTWAVRSSQDTVLEPSCGDAVFLRSAGRRLASFGASSLSSQLRGYDIHRDSLDDAGLLLAAEGLDATLLQGDFFEVFAHRRVTAVVGNPPFIRFQGFTGESRRAALARSAEAGVDLSGLASSWAAFVVHGSSFLVRGGRLGLVLPAELMSVNYAGPVRQFLLESFSSVDLVVFDELVFAGIQADVVVLLADGYKTGSADHFRLHSAKDVSSISTDSGRVWKPGTPSDRWTDALAPNDGASVLGTLKSGMLSELQAWGSATSGIVTGANSFFAISQSDVRLTGLSRSELRPVLPAGTTFATRAVLTASDWRTIAETRPGYLFVPAATPSKAALAYIAEGERLKLHERYKCRIREPWWRVPLGSPPELFVSYMSGTTPRIVSNSARVLNLNSVHGLRVPQRLRRLAQASLPVMAMSSASLLSAELVGRSYGGGILKLEPREASRWLVPSPEAMAMAIDLVEPMLARGRRLLRAGDVDGCTAIADQILTNVGTDASVLRSIRETRLDMVKRRVTRGTSKASSGGSSL